MSTKQVAEYEHPTDCVVISLPVRDRIMARLNAAEARVETLTADLRAAQEIIENVRQTVAAWQAVSTLIRAMGP